MYCTIIEAFVHHATCTPNKICIVDEEKEYTYSNAFERLKGIVALLREKKVRKGEAIVVECTQDADYLLLSLACQWIGAIFVPIENRMNEERVKEIVCEVDAKILCTKSIRTGLDCEWFMEDFEVADCMDDVEIDFVDEDSVAEILFTTGTTGAAKGIVLSNKNNTAIAQNIIYGTKMEKDSVELIPLPLSHSHGLRSCYANLYNGSSIIISKGIFNINWIFAAIEKYKASAIDLSPNAAQLMLKLAKGAFEKYVDQIKFIQIGTASLDEQLKERLCQTFYKSRLYNFYGSTESGRTCVLEFNKAKGKKNCVGLPAINAKFKITNEQRERIESDPEHLGYIAVSGKMNMIGYLHDSNLTERTLVGEYLYSNDLGYIDQDGYVYVVGRADDVINYKGIKIMPEEIEKPALLYSGIQDCACIAIDDSVCGQVPILFVQVDGQNIVDKVKMTDFLRGKLEISRMPKDIITIEKIPRASNGKLLRRKLREEF